MQIRGGKPPPLRQLADSGWELSRDAARPLQWMVEGHERATSRAAAHFLDMLVDRRPFPIAAPQVDGGSEFAAECELACQRSSCSRHARPNSTVTSNALIARTTRSSIRWSRSTGTSRILIPSSG